jgi:uncharacterized protein (AIM24 family)
VVALPSLVPTKAKAKTYADVAWHIGLEAVPVLTVDVSKTGVFFEHHTLLWKHPTVKLALKANAGPKRMVAGAPVFIAEAKGPGMIAFSRDGPGRILAMEMPFGREIEVREHQFVAATERLCHRARHVKGPASRHPGGQGCFIDQFASYKGDGVLWLYAYGSVFEKRLATGESIDIEAGAWLYKESAVAMEAISERLAAGPLGAHMTMTVHRFTGPGRVGVQSMYLPNASEG